MKKLLLLWILLLAACAPPLPDGTVAPPPVDVTSLESAEPDIERQAVFIKIENDIRARLPTQSAFTPAHLGQVLPVKGEARSGEASKARLDLQPEGTIVRLGPNSHFTLEDLTTDAAYPLTRIRLFLGKLWITLSSGTLDVETPYGTAGVRGSMMSVSFDEETLRVTCLEGHCTLSNQAGSVELTAGQAAAIESADQPPGPPLPMTEADFQDWAANSPESLETMPPPPSGQPESQPSPPPPDQHTAEDTRSSGYRLTNNCPPEEGVWHWLFRGPTTVQVDIPPGATISGTLPPGDYLVSDWMNGGQAHNTTPFPAGGFMDATACPDQE